MKYLLLGMVLLLTACNFDHSYVLKITKQTPDAFGTLIPKTDTFNIKAPDDRTAYSRCLEKFMKNQMVDSIMNYTTGKTVFFYVYDSEGLDLKTKLTPKITDEIDKDYQKLKIRVQNARIKNTH